MGFASFCNTSFWVRPRCARHVIEGQRNESPARHNYVTLRAFLVLSALPVFAETGNLARLLEAVEKRYNKATTLQITFEETLSAAGQGRRAESGELFLRKPGRMRWEYSNPPGKLFLSDGRNIYYYNPSSKRAEKMKLKESEDMRAPLAFLLGKLDFSKDFKNFRATEHPLGTLVTGDPKSDKLPYKQVEFVVSGDGAIRELRVHGYDNSLLAFNFSNEKLNPPVSDKLFQFELPAGGIWVDSSNEEASR
jgi:outer membrane lipoprotein carrier protein